MNLTNLGFMLVTFVLMEGVAWGAHKFLMHGLLWKLHEDHHIKDPESKLERNDWFFVIFALPAILLFAFGMEKGLASPLIWIAIGITAYGLVYFFIHEIFIHQRLPLFKKSKIPFLNAIRKAHKVHHKQHSKYGATCFGMLIVPNKFYKEAKNKMEQYG